MRWTANTINDFTNGIGERGYASDAAWERLHSYEKVVHDVCVTVWWMEGWPGFSHFFERGFDGNQIADAFDAIEHPMGAVTIRYAQLIRRASPYDDDLDTLGSALLAMRNSIFNRLGHFLDRHAS